MREDYQEALEKMFPDGYVITYVQKNKDFAYQWHNPNNEEFLHGILILLSTLTIENEGEE